MALGGRLIGGMAVQLLRRGASNVVFSRPQKCASLANPEAAVPEVDSLFNFIASPNTEPLEMLKDTHDRVHTYLRISLTEKCNLRCTYCMGPNGVDSLTPRNELLTTDEIVKIAGLFVRGGVTKIRLTGGEPLIRKDIEELCERIGELRSDGLQTFGMTTNGITLAKKLPRLHAAGLNKLNISLDTLDPHKFVLITRKNGYDKVRAAIDAAIEYGYRPKINNVVMRGLNDDEVVNFVALTKDQPVQIRFIEYMPFDGNQWKDTKLVPYFELIDRIQQHFGLPLERLEDHKNATSKTFQLPGHVGSIGFITSMSDHFCGSCNRLRITADGNLKVCLFGNTEVSLRDAIRDGASDDELRDVVSLAVKKKKARHAGMHELALSKNRPMVRIGG